MTRTLLKHSWGLLAGALAALLIVATWTPSAHAANPAGHRQNLIFVGAADATGGSTFATTSFADLAAASVSYTPLIDPNAGGLAGNVNTDNVIVSYSGDVSKATATSGTCGVFLNGAQVTKTQRSVTSAAGQSDIAGTFVLANTTTGTQTVKIQCKSGDTNVFTVNNLHLTVMELY